MRVEKSNYTTSTSLMSGKKHGAIWKNNMARWVENIPNNFDLLKENNIKITKPTLGITTRIFFSEVC